MRPNTMPSRRYSFAAKPKMAVVEGLEIALPETPATRLPRSH